jgi:hypothetical protein
LFNMPATGGSRGGGIITFDSLNDFADLRDGPRKSASQPDGPLRGGAGHESAWLEPEPDRGTSGGCRSGLRKVPASALMSAFLE